MHLIYKITLSISSFSLSRVLFLSTPLSPFSLCNILYIAQAGKEIANWDCQSRVHHCRESDLSLSLPSDLLSSEPRAPGILSLLLARVSSSSFPSVTIALICPRQSKIKDLQDRLLGEAGVPFSISLSLSVASRHIVACIGDLQLGRRISSLGCCKEQSCFFLFPFFSLRSFSCFFYFTIFEFFFFFFNK